MMKLMMILSSKINSAFKVGAKDPSNLPMNKYIYVSLDVSKIFSLVFVIIDINAAICIF